MKWYQPFIMCREEILKEIDRINDSIGLYDHVMGDDLFFIPGTDEGIDIQQISKDQRSFMFYLLSLLEENENV